LAKESKERLNLIFEKMDQDCLCLRVVSLTYKIATHLRLNTIIELNGNELDYRKHDPNESRDVTELYATGQVKSIKMYLG
jgi:hypothetical protein